MDCRENTRKMLPEELASCIEESTIHMTDEYTCSPEVLRVGEAVIGTLGNFSASIGKAKSKKTFNVSAIVASALSNDEVLRYNSDFPSDKRNILYIDTEQGRHLTFANGDINGYEQVREALQNGYASAGYKLSYNTVDVLKFLTNKRMVVKEKNGYHFMPDFHY